MESSAVSNRHECHILVQHESNALFDNMRILVCLPVRVSGWQTLSFLSEEDCMTLKYGEVDDNSKKSI